MSPSVAIKSLINLGVYNLIITSGTLSPLESFECEMGIPFHVKLQNSHVINQNQLSIQIILKDPSGNDLSGSFEKRNDVNYYNGLGYTIIELCRVVPKGVFIFFSSYSLINKCIEMWKERQGVNIWNAISNKKKVFVEPRNKNEFNEHMQAFKDTVDNSTEGAIFMGVSRGKLSEGIDLGDDYCRAVVIIGLPYPARYDPKVILKQKYLDENNAKINGIKWYMLQMKRALNQSIGRVVRHKHDYGAIIICDSRFRQLQDGLSRWIQAFVTRQSFSCVDFRSKLADIQQFFRQIENNVVIKVKESSPSIKEILPPKKSNTSCNVDKGNDDIIKSALDDMKNSKFVATKFKKSISLENCDSIFDSFGLEESLLNKSTKRSLKQESVSEYFNKDSSIKKSKVALKNVSYFNKESNSHSKSSVEIPVSNCSPVSSRNDKIKQMSKYLSRNDSFEKNDIEIKEKSHSNVIDLSSDDESDSKNIPEKITAVDYSTEEMKFLLSNILTTNTFRMSFERVLQEVLVSLDFKLVIYILYLF